MIDTEKLDNLPKKISIKKDLVSRYGSIWNTRLYHSYTKEYSLWILAERIIKNNIGKNYNTAYKYYIKKSKYYYNNYEANTIFNYKFNSERYNDYYVDDNGLIQQIPKDKYKLEIGIISDDYKIVNVHKETGHLKDLFYEKWSKKLVTHSRILRDGSTYTYSYKENDKFLGYQYKNKYYLAQEEDFINKVVSGSKQIFTSKNDYRYIRYWSNWRKTYKAKQRKLKLEKSLALESKFREILNAKKLKDKEKNDMIIIKHGFCPKTSFRNFI